MGSKQQWCDWLWTISLRQGIRHTGYFVMEDDDRILVSYGPENTEEIEQQLIELKSQELVY